MENTNICSKVQDLRLTFLKYTILATKDKHIMI